VGATADGALGIWGTAGCGVPGDIAGEFGVAGATGGQLGRCESEIKECVSEGSGIFALERKCAVGWERLTVGAGFLMLCVCCLIMNLPPPPPPPPAVFRQGFDNTLVVVGILFILGWVGMHVLWGALSGMANMMANDSGRASSGAQMTLILTFLLGVILAGLAGVPAGLAVFWRGKRLMLLGLFVVLFLAGAACEWMAWSHFFASMEH